MHNFVARIFTVLVLLLFGSVQVSAQQDQLEWNVGRIFVPTENQESVIPEHFWPIELRELNEKLEQHETRVAEQRLNPLVLDRAVYLATLNRDMIVSDNSFWKFSGIQLGSSFRVGSVSFALKDAKGNFADQKQLSTVQRFDVNGSIEIETNSIEQPFWFGFQIAPQIEESRRVFRFEVPRAKLALLLISAESGVVLESDQCVIEQVTNPRTHLGENWPASIEPRTQPRQNWWLAHIAGLDKFSIEVSENSADRGQVFQHTVSSATIVHQVSPDSINSTATFQLANESSGVPIQLKLAANQRIRSLTIDGKSATWKALSTDSNATTKETPVQHLIQLNSSNHVKASKIEVQTIRKTSDSVGAAEFRLSLPTLEISNSVVINGNTVVNLDETLEVASVQSAQTFIQSKSSDLEMDSNRWRTTWSRQPPGASFLVRNRIEKWSASTFVRLEPQANAIAARINMVLIGSHLRTNVLRLPVLPGWNVERVRLPLDATGKIRTRLETAENGEQIVLAWVGKPENFEAYLEVTANRLIGGNPKSLAVENPRVIQSPKQYSPAYFVISDSPYYRLRNSPTLFPMSIAKRDLTSWQQQLVREHDVGIFKDLADANNRFVIDSIPYPTTLRQATLVQEDNSELLYLRTFMVFEPGLVGIDQIKLNLPVGQEIENWSFEFRSEGEPSISLSPLSTQSEIDGNVLCSFGLPQLINSPFVLVATSKQPATDPKTNSKLIPIVSALESTTVESTLILQSNLAPLATGTALVFQPSTTCCSAEIVEQIDLDLKSFTKSDSAWLSAKIVNTDASFIALTAAASQSESIVWRQVLQHEITAAGIIRHSHELDLQASKGARIELTVPDGWKLIESHLDGIELDTSVGESRALIVQWPKEDRATLRFRFEQQAPTLGAISKFNFLQPTLAIPSLATEETIKIPTGYVSFNPSTLLTQSSPKFPSYPSQLWYILSPANSTNYFGSNELTWSIDPEVDDRTIWLVNRASLATAYLVMLALLGMIAWLLIRRSIRIWWIAFAVTLATFITIKTGPICALQLLLLSLVLGLVARMIELVSHRPKSNLRRSPISICWLIAIFVLPVSQVLGQSSDGSSTGRSPQKVYGVIIPFESSPDAPGDYAYISKELRDLLAGANQNSPAKSPDPKLISANYLMKLRQDPRAANPLQEFEAEFKIVVPDPNGQLLLPFDLSTLRPTSQVLNGQPRPLGVRYFEEAEDAGGIVFRPDTTGIVTVNLKFQVSTKDSVDRKFSFTTKLPAAPNATLRIIPNALTTTVATNASGGLLRTLSNDYIAHLGSIDELNVQWSEGDRNTTSFISEYVSETWIRGQQDGFTVACQLTIDRGRSTQEEFDLIVDSDWEPVGTAWGDAQLVSSNIISPLKRRVIRVKLSEASGLTCSIRILLAQRQPLRATAVDVPFISVDRMSLKGRVFWWSTDVRSAWLPEGIELLPTRMARDDWGELRLASERSGYQVLGSGIKLRSLPANSAILTYSESTTLRLFHSHSELEMDANWEKSAFAENDLVLQLPANATLKKLEANGRAILAPLGSQDRVVVAQTVIGPNTNKIKVQVELPPMQGKAETLPRIEIESMQPRQGNYAVVRGSELAVRFLPTDSGLVFSPVTGRRANIENLETFVGEANLPSELLSDPYLAAPIEVLPSSAAQHRSYTMSVERTGANFRATVRCVWSAATSPDYAIFELPATLRDQISVASLSSLFKPNRDENKTTLCIPIPAANSNDTRLVEFSVPIMSAATSQTLTIPTIIATHSVPDLPVVTLPSNLDGKQVRWQSNGEAPVAEWFTKAGLERQAGTEYLRFSSGPAKLSWQFIDAEKSQSNVSIIVLDVTSISKSNASGVVNYGIAAKNQTDQVFEVDPSCQVLGVDCGARSAYWSKDGNLLRVTMQTNASPCLIRIMVRWVLGPAESPMLRPPKPLNASLPSELHLLLPSNSAWSISGSESDSSGDDRSVLHRWAELLVESMNIANSSGAMQHSGHFESWNPQIFKLTSDQLITSPALRGTIATYDSNDDGDISVAELWLQASGRDAVESINPRGGTFGPIARYRLESQLVTLVKRLDTSPRSNDRILAAAAVLLVGFLGLMLAPTLRLPTLSILASQPWIYWGLLALIVAIALPVSWPSWIIAITSVWMAISQLIDYRRRTRHFGF